MMKGENDSNLRSKFSNGLNTNTKHLKWKQNLSLNVKFEEKNYKIQILCDTLNEKRERKQNRKLILNLHLTLHHFKQLQKANDIR